MRTAAWAELPGNLASAFGRFPVQRQLSGNNETYGVDNDIHRSISRQVLAVAAPTDPARERLRYDPKTDCAAKATTSSLEHLFDSL
jgi:hypothetical protein